mmetsp:Transcript_26035/g.67137  ORF Transcript_26035/g.67137 Transcript_26035/m.67137 type:complete len:105 (-) Transcript_26035:62-376(-)
MNTMDAFLPLGELHPVLQQMSLHLTCFVKKVCTGTSLAAHRLRIDSDTDLDLCGQSSQATQMCTDSDLIAHRLSTGSNTDVGFCGQTSQITQIHTKSILTLHRF